MLALRARSASSLNLNRLARTGNRKVRRVSGRKRNRLGEVALGAAQGRTGAAGLGKPWSAAPSFLVPAGQATKKRKGRLADPSVKDSPSRLRFRPPLHPSSASAYWTARWGSIHRGATFRSPRGVARRGSSFVSGNRPEAEEPRALSDLWPGPSSSPRRAGLFAAVGAARLPAAPTALRERSDIENPSEWVVTLHNIAHAIHGDGQD